MQTDREPLGSFTQVSVEDYKEIMNRLDERTLRAAYVGRWASREAFGQELLADTSAHQRLADLPGWLRPFVRIDEQAFVSDLEAEGVYLLTPSEDGVHVFDAAIVQPKTRR